jgi:hypothetical protein
LGHIIVDAKNLIQKPLFPGKVHISAQAQTSERILRQEGSATRQRCHRSRPKQQNVTPGAAMEHLRICLKLGERPLFEEAPKLIVH